MNISRVGLNLLYLVPGATGGSEIYARGLIPAMASAAPHVEFVLFLSDPAFAEWSGRDRPDNVVLRRVRVDGRSRISRVVAEQTLLPIAARKTGVDLLHSLASTAPVYLRLPSVVTILDLIYLRFPETHTRLLGAGMRFLVPRAAKSSDRVIAISHATKTDLVERIGIPPSMIDVVYLGDQPRGRWPGASAESGPSSEDRDRALALELGIAGGPVLLSVSAKRPHKNLDTLIDAFSRMDRDPPPFLVLPGYPTAHEVALRERARVLGVEDRVVLPGWVDEQRLESLYRLAAVMVFPSLYEGFGLPVLEAMRRGVPVACSTAGSLPEIAGDAARYFDPRDTVEMSAAVEELLDDRALRDRLVRAGRARAEAFTWERTARETLDVYRRVFAR